MSHFSFSIIIILLTINRILYNTIFNIMKYVLNIFYHLFCLTCIVYIYAHIFVYIRYVVYEILDSTFSTNIFYDTYHF